MKTTTVLVLPAVILSTVFAWGKAEAPAHTEASIPAPSRRHDYKQSLKKPFTFNDELPFWDKFGNSFIANDFIRLAPSVPGLKGSLWRSTPNTHKEWEVEFTFRAFGQGSVGGKGIAFWYTEERTTTEGPIFGIKDKWKGLGIFMDSSDPANQDDKREAGNGKNDKKEKRIGERIKGEREKGRKGQLDD
ncbi:Protein ERGIC-53 [Entomortierella beljakovae]|nr:Protein ERGIC-53 [Entomortierella beljakovae]